MVLFSYFFTKLSKKKFLRSSLNRTLFFNSSFSGHDGVDARHIVGAAARPDDGAADESVVVATVDVTRWASFVLFCSIIYELIHEIILSIPT